MEKNRETSFIIGLALTLGVVVAGFVADALFFSFDAGDEDGSIRWSRLGHLIH